MGEYGNLPYNHFYREHNLAFGNEKEHIESFQIKLELRKQNETN